MSYPRTLDEYDDRELEAELRRRKQFRQRGNCDYCGRPTTEPVCRFPLRHKLECKPVKDTTHADRIATNILYPEEKMGG